MTEHNGHDLLMKQLMKQLLENQLEDVRRNDKGNSSFVFLENHTLNLLLLSYLMRSDSGTALPKAQHSPQDYSAAIQEIERMTDESKEAFEEVVAMLKERI